jgi:hypothetical protein
MITNNFYNTAVLPKYMNSSAVSHYLDSDLKAMSDLRSKLLEFECHSLNNLESDVKDVIHLDHLLIYEKPYDAETYPRITLDKYFEGMYPGDFISDCRIFVCSTSKQDLLDEVRHFNTYKNILTNKNPDDARTIGYKTYYTQHNIRAELYHLLFPDEFNTLPVLDIWSLRHAILTIESAKLVDGNIFINPD